jgi:hypothetical protein
MRALSDYDAWKFGIRETIGPPRLRVRCRHGLNPDPLPLQFENDVRAGLSARKGVTTIRGLFQESTSEIHLPEPPVEIAADLCQEMRVRILLRKLLKTLSVAVPGPKGSVLSNAAM